MTTGVMTAPGFLARERTIAGPGFSRWLIPPAALAIHLCIGMAYGFSVFWLPLSKALGITTSIQCAADMGFWARATTTACDWKVSDLSITFQLFFVFLGAASFICGGWLERAGPRKAGIVATLCWCGGLAISAYAVSIHQLWLLWLGSGVIGGIGLGLGYISPVSTLIKWFPDRRGMATGMAIMGFGGGAMIGAPLADRLMKHFATASSVGVWETFLTLAIVYFVFMLGGALGYRIPAESWKPRGWQPAPTAPNALVTSNHVALKVAFRTEQFWLLWAVLCLNVTAGIGILSMASPLLQEVFGGRLISVSATFDQLTPDQKSQVAAIAAGFTGLLSLFNILGRIFWASLSDRIGRKTTYAVFFILGVALYSSIPWTAATVNLALFAGFFCVILSMYGGGFATVPAYLADLFGTRFVGAIHGRLLTAWSVAGILGPMVVTYIRDYQKEQGVPAAQNYNITMFILAGFLAVGLLCNWLIRPVDSRKYMTREQLDATAPKKPVGSDASTASGQPAAAGDMSGFVIVLAWLVVWIPLGWGVAMTLQKAMQLFR